MCVRVYACVCACVCVCVCVSHRDMLLQVLSRSQLVVCYKAKDLLRTALQFYGQDLSWKQGRAHINKSTYSCRVLPVWFSYIN